MYMSRAGRPPAESIKVWDRMRKEAGGGVPTFYPPTPATSSDRRTSGTGSHGHGGATSATSSPGNMREVIWR